MQLIENILTPTIGKIKQDITAYDLFALTVSVMLLGHLIAFFYKSYVWLNIPDRTLLPVFLISIGYNSGHKISKLMWFGALITSLSGFFLFKVVHIYILGTMIGIKLILDKLLSWLITSKKLFWTANFLFATLSTLTHALFEFGTIAVIMATAGWLNKNKHIVPEDIIKPKEYFIFSYITYMVFVNFTSALSTQQLCVLAVGAAFIMWLLYDFKKLLLNSIRRKPKDIIEKFCHFLGHKSLEIYIIQHLIFFHLVFYFEKIIY